jgi:hypothetical protein
MSPEFRIAFFSSLPGLRVHAPVDPSLQHYLDRRKLAPWGGSFLPASATRSTATEANLMTICASCNRELKTGEEFDLVKIQQWRTKVGSAECKRPDSDDTRSYCIPCAKSAPIPLMMQ